MKKTTAIFFVMISVALLSACGGGNPPSLEERAAEAQNQVESIKSYSGTIESLGVDIYNDGTHKITTDSGQSVTIQSHLINLNNYIGKKVTVTGSVQKLVDNKTEVFTVEKIDLVTGDSAVQQYSNKKFGFAFSFPEKWEISEGDKGVDFSVNGAQVVKIDIFSNIDSSLDDFVKTKEIEDGTSVTVGGQRSLRFSSSGGIDIYVPNVTMKKVYKISFVGSDGSGSSGDKDLFYSLIESFSVNQKQAVSGDKCGGKENVICQEGYICELENDSLDAEGVCVSTSGTGANLDCPFVPVPTGCSDYSPKSTNKNGCPTSYVCNDEKAAQTPSSAVQPDAPVSSASPEGGKPYENVISSFAKNSEILLPEGAQIQRYEVAMDQKLIAVIFTADSAKTRSVYKFSGDAGDYSFTKMASYKTGEDRDWVLADGQDVKMNYDKVVVDAEGGNTQAQMIYKDMRLYENTFKNFSLQYPSSWYYKSFGSVNGSVWTVGFSAKSIEKSEDSSITVSILKDPGEERRAMNSDKYTAEVKRDETSHFFIIGPLEMKDIIDKMADTIKQN